MDPVRLQTSLLDQIALVVSAFGLKPGYMLICLGLIILLGLRFASLGPELKLLLAALVGFELGELFCAANYILAGGKSDVLEFGHHAGMIAFGALLPWAVFDLLDRRVLRFSDPEATCAAQRFCKRCWKRDEVACGLQRLMLLAAPALALMALMPLAASLLSYELILPVFGSDVYYQLSPDEQWALYRLYPFLAAGLLLITFGLLLRGQRGLGPARWTFFWGIGFMAFSLLRFFLVSAYQSMPIWADAWEELTEMIAIVSVVLLLWVFRRPLGLSAPGPQPEEA